MSLFRFLKGAKPAAAASSGFLGLWAGADNRLYVTDDANIDAPVDGRLIPHELSAATVLTAAHHARLLMCTGTWSLTAPDPVTLPAGMSCRVSNLGSGVITLVGGTTGTLAAGKSFDLTATGTGWIISGRDGQSDMSGLLIAIGDLTMTADRMIYGTGAGAVGLTTLTGFGRTLMAAADAPSARTAMGAGTVAGVTVTVGAGLTGGGTITTSGTVTVSISTSSNGYGTRTVSTSAPSGGTNGDVWIMV